MLTQAARKPVILAKFKSQFEAPHNYLDTQPCDHFPGTSYSNLGSQKNWHFGELKAPNYS